MRPSVTEPTTVTAAEPPHVERPGVIVVMFFDGASALGTRLLAWFREKFPPLLIDVGVRAAAVAPGLLGRGRWAVGALVSVMAETAVTLWKPVIRLAAFGTESSGAFRVAHGCNSKPDIVSVEQDRP